MYTLVYMHIDLASLTTRQREALEFIREQVAEAGRPPTVREVCSRFQYSSPRAGKLLLDALERKGYLKRTGRCSRNIVLTIAATGVPIVGDVAAGQPILAVENITGSLDLTTAFGHEEVFAVRVKGESMIKSGILHGDYVIVRRQPDVLNGTIAVAYLNGEATVKRIYKTRSGYQLKAENDSFLPIDIKGSHSATDDDPNPDFRIAGPVVGVVRMVKP
jgi:repressor LexA